MEKGGSGKNGALTKASDVGERKPLLKKRKVTIIASPLKGEDDPNATSWISIYMASALSFVGAAQYTLYFTSLWPYIRKVDPSISESFFGYIIAVYSVGQIISSPLFGYWSNRIKGVRLPIVIGFIFMLVGNMIYLTLEFADVPYRGAFLIVSRLLLGIGSGNVVLLRSYAATSPAMKDRSRAIAFVTCGQALGLTGGPAFQLLFTPLGYPGWSLVRTHLRLNVYTAPAYLSCLMNVLSVVIMQTIFHENYAGLVETGSTSNIDTPKPKSQLPPYDLIAVGVCLVTRFTYMFINTNLETIGSPYSMMMFSWEEERTVFYTSIAQGLIGLLTLGTYIVYILLKFESWLNLRIASICALFVLIVFHLITYSWPFLSGHVDITHNHTSSGCNIDKFEWCENLRPVNVWLYYTSYILALGLAFPMLNIGNTTLYSDVLGPRRQGTMQGVLQVAGGAARLVGPIVISTFYTAYGPVMAWNMEVFVIGTTVVLWFIFYGRIVSLVPADVEKIHSISVIDVVPDLSAPSSILSSHGDSQLTGVGSTASAGKIPSKKETSSTPLIDYQ